MTFAGVVLVRVTLKRRPPSPGGGQLASGSVGDVLELEPADEEARGAREEKLGGSFMIEMVSLRGMRRGAEEYGWEGTTGATGRTAAMMSERPRIGRAHV